MAFWMVGLVDHVSNVEARFVLDVGDQVRGDGRHSFYGLDVLVDEPAQVRDVTAEDIHEHIVATCQRGDVPGLVEPYEEGRDVFKPSCFDVQQKRRVQAESGPVWIQPDVEMQDSALAHLLDPVSHSADTDAHGLRYLAVAGPAISAEYPHDLKI